MTKANPELDAQLDRLVEICCQLISGEGQPTSTEVDSLVEALVRNGFHRHSEEPLSAELDRRIRKACKDSAMHRGARIKGIVERIQSRFDDQARWNATQPSSDSAESVDLNATSPQ